MQLKAAIWLSKQIDEDFTTEEVQEAILQGLVDKFTDKHVLLVEVSKAQ